VRALGVALGFGLGVVSGCPSSTFLCQTDSECGSGQCESSGFCSFEDDSCDSGRRYEPNAGEGLGGTCVPSDGGGTGTGTGAGTGTASSTASGGDATGDGSTGPLVDESGSDEATVGGPERPAITIDPATRFQTVDGFGVQVWDYPIVGDNNWNWEAAAPRFGELDLHYAQMISIFHPWEPANDNADPYLQEPSGFDPWGFIGDKGLIMAQWLADQGYDLIVQKVAMPGWLFGGEGFDPLLYPELAESIVSHSMYLEDNGVTNRPLHLFQMGSSSTAFPTPDAAADAGSELALSIEAFGVDRSLMTPAVPGADADTWLAAWFSRDLLVDNTEAILLRGIETSLPTEFAAVGAWSEQTGVPVWAWDNWYCGADQGCPAAPAEDSSTWASAWEQAQQNVRLLVDARASRIYHAAMVGAQPSIDPETGDPYPTFWVLMHFANWIPADGVVLGTDTGVEGLMSVAVERPDGTIGLILLNTSPFDAEIDVRLPDGPAQLSDAVQSIPGEYLTPLDPIGSMITLPVDSLTSLTLSP